MPSPVHPRACGEHAIAGIALSCGIGSSPRLRGTQVHLVEQPARVRFIPAPVGNTFQSFRRKPSLSVHPRACGEHPDRLDRSAPSCGSSPRLRGTLASDISKMRLRRFIPAPAGNTSERAQQCPAAAVHPRACGEHSAPVGSSAGAAGSSPRLRGTHRRRRQRDQLRRFIPAPAGNTSKARASPSTSPVHPRACGERELEPNQGRRFDGSSPRLRGTRLHPRHLRFETRFIPAPPGNT